MVHTFLSPLEPFISYFTLCPNAVPAWLGLPLFFISASLQTCLVVVCIVYVLASVIAECFTYTASDSVTPSAYIINRTLLLYPAFLLYRFLKQLLLAQLKVTAFTPFISFLFLIVFLLNVVGLLPYTFTLTAQFSFTLFLSLFAFFWLNLYYISIKRLSSVELFVPSGVPLFILPFLIQIEIISYISRVFSLSIRLFANMVSGHTLLKILGAFTLNLFALSGFGIILSVIPMIIVIIVTGL